MKALKASVDGFLKKYGMHYEDLDMKQECDAFIKEMEKGLQGDASTLKMLCTYLGAEGDISIGEPVIVMDAGGTNFRVAVVSFDKNKKPIMEYFKLYSMPGTTGELSKEEFFRTIADYLLPVIDRSEKIGFCFSYPIEILPNKDGKLIGFTKEVKVKNVKGEEIGANLLRVLKKMGYAADKKIVLLNDTVATLLGGKAALPEREFDSSIGFILGTGTNTCYLEENSNIRNALHLCAQPGTTIINIESGGYGKAIRGSLDKSFDSTTGDPGKQQFEKMIAGAYQGGLIFEVIRKACEEGLLSQQFANNLSNIKHM